MLPTPKRTDFHPHDRFVATAVRGLARIDRQLRSPDHEADTQNRPSVMRYLQDLVPWCGRPEPTGVPQRALWTLLHDSDFRDLLPFVLEKFNTAAGYTDLPNRGRLRNVDRQALDTYYTPLDLARWVASQTTERVCRAVSHPPFPGGRKYADEVLCQILKIRVCDMSCGAGILLREALVPIASAYRRIYEVLGARGSARYMGQAPFFSRGLVKLQALLTNVYGIDIAPLAVESAQTVLAVWAADELQIAGLTAADVVRLLRLNIRVGSGSHWSIGIEAACGISIAEKLIRAASGREEARQALLDHREIRPDCPELEIVTMFPEVFVKSNPGFTSIVGNPPFGRLPEGVENSENVRPTSLFGFGSQQEPSTRWQYPKFVEGLYRLTQRGGFSAIVTPLNLAYGREFAGLRGSIERAPLRSTFNFFDRSPDALFGDNHSKARVVA